MLSRFAIGKPILTASVVRTVLKQQPKKPFTIRRFSRENRENVSKSYTRPTLKEIFLAPAGPNAYALGKGALAGGSVLGLGALCYYGLGQSKGISIVDNSILWPEYVKERIQDTYAYFGGSLLVSAASAVAVFRTPAALHLVTRSGFLAVAGTMAALIASGFVAHSIPYRPGLGAKQLAWVTHCAILGGVIAPICILGGPLITRAMWYTAGVVGGLSTVAVCAPSDRFLYMAGPLAIGLGTVFAASMGSMFLGPATAIGAGLHSISLYGGLLLFSGFLLYDTQRVVREAEATHSREVFDPVNASLSIYMDTVNIFIRIASILSGAGNRRK